MIIIIISILALVVMTTVAKEIKRANHTWCSCYVQRPVISSLGDIFSLKKKKGENGFFAREGEFWELLLAVAGIRDEGLGYFKGVYHEISDIAYAVGKIIGKVFHKEYISVIGDGASYETKHGRMQKQGCYRSKRLLVNGKCPSEKGVL
jgi:hypothetical protein